MSNPISTVNAAIRKLERTYAFEIMRAMSEWGIELTKEQQEVMDQREEKAQRLASVLREAMRKEGYKQNDRGAFME